MKAVLYPGSFDPPTLGHFNIIEKALTCFDVVHVGIGCNPDKTPLFTPDARLDFFLNYVHRNHLDGNVIVETYDGLTVDYARSKGITTMIRGLRDGADLKSEHYISRVNTRIAGINTVFMFPDDEHILVSSSFVRQVAELGKDREKLRGMVDDNVLQALGERFDK